MLDYLIPKDEEDNDSEYHNSIRTQTERPIQTADDRDYSPEEIRMAIEAINRKMHPVKTESPAKYYSALTSNSRLLFTHNTTSA